MFSFSLENVLYNDYNHLYLYICSILCSFMFFGETIYLFCFMFVLSNKKNRRTKRNALPADRSQFGTYFIYKKGRLRL